MISLNNEQRLYVIPSGAGYSCLGFDVCHKQTEAIARELSRPDLMPTESGTLAAYESYMLALTAARESGRRLTCELTPQLIGLEGRRVEVTDSYGETRRFKVGKSTGYIPIHLELANSRSSGGCGVFGAPFRSVRVIR